MKFRYPFLLFCGVLISACEKNTVSKIPNLSLVGFGPADTIRAGIDDPFIVFRFTDGDADISNGSSSAVFIRDSRYDTFAKYDFPKIDESILDPKKGIAAQGVVFPDYPFPRLDSIHLTNGDTLYYEMYITDRANNRSNTVTSQSIITK
jgi:hypothetical protein